MIVYGTSISPFVRKALFFIGEKGLPVDHQPVMPQDNSTEFRASSPLGKIPGLVDGDFKLADSTAICHYVDRKYAANPMFPASAEESGRIVWFDKYSDTVQMASFGKVFFELFVKPKMLSQEPDMANVQQGLSELPPIYDFLESQVNGPFLVGNKISLADIAIACPFVNLAMVGHGLDAAKWPKLAAYLNALFDRPAFKAISDKKA